MEKEKLSPFLEGELIDLCPLRREDAEQYIRWLNDPISLRFLGMHRPLSKEEERRIIDRLLHIPIVEGLIVGIWLKEPHELIGNVKLEKIDVRGQHAEISLFIGKEEMRGLGYCREALHLLLNYAFRTLNLRKVWGRYLDPSDWIKACYESAGLFQAGRLKAHRFIDGQWHDEVLMELFRNQYFNQQDNSDSDK
jgi:RimJ/RimL family protein N-acetyltransferase